MIRIISIVCALTIAGSVAAQPYDSLAVNNINAQFMVSGHMFNDFQGGSPAFEVPKGSGKHTIFSSNLWVGGLDANGQLHLAAELFRQNGEGYVPGPISNSGDCDSINYNRFWRVKRGEIEALNAWQQNPSAFPNYTPPNWAYDFPGNGNTALGYSNNYFPYYENGNNWWFSAFEGDYPLIRGDEALLFIFNDRCSTSNIGAEPMGIEVRAMAYAFDCPEDSALYNTIFVHYDIVNRSSNAYHDTWVGLWSDLDLGSTSDDFIACDVMRGAYYAYNGDEVDGSGSPSHYGAHPPAQAVVFLGGPYQDGDNMDNNFGIGFNESLNGLGYGDGIPDNERLGMGRFMYHNNSSGVHGDPQTPDDHYNYMRGFWRDNTQMVYGGGGSLNSCTSCEPANYMFPGNSDSLYYWGTSGMPVSPWNEVVSGNTPGDRRGLGSVGPFTFEPGEIASLDLAFVFGRDYNGGAWESVEVMNQRIDAIREMFVNDSVPGPCGGGFNTLPLTVRDTRAPTRSQINIYPNPANDELNVKFSRERGEEWNISIVDMTGKLLYSGVANQDIARLDVDFLEAGIYLLRAESASGEASKVFVKR